MNTEDKNKLIAEFMGLTVIQSPIKDENGEYQWHFDGRSNFPRNTVVQSTLKYNYDWNYLIDVVEKITTISYKKGRKFDFHINSVFVEITVDRMNFKPFSKWGATNNKKEAVYNACIEFIQWFDQQKSS